MPSLETLITFFGVSLLLALTGHIVPELEYQILSMTGAL